MVDTKTRGCSPISAQRDLASERALLAESRIFDEAGYLARAGEQARPDPIGHYLETGWRLGLEPNGSFPGSMLQPHFDTLTRSQPPAVTWLFLRSAGWPMPGSRGEIEHAATSVRNTGLFDESFYRSHLGPDAAGLDPATHYVIVGERMGLAPSPEFDPRYYAARNPDVREAAMNCLLHYAHHGRAEGRLPKPVDVRTEGRAPYDPTKENVILVVHDTSRTGAPILGWNLGLRLAQRYNLFTVRMGDGELTPEYEAISVEVYGPFWGAMRSEVDVMYSLGPLLEGRVFRYAIINSAESRLLVEPCVRRSIPTVFLIHEFASYVHPLSSLISALDWSTEVVFSAPMVAAAAKEAHPNLSCRTVRILPQGVTKLPPNKAEGLSKDASSVLCKLDARRNTEGTFIVLGIGTVHLRKGVDLFLAAAAAIIRQHPSCRIHFLWVGEGYFPQTDMNYSVYLREQINRSGLNEYVTFLGAVPDVQPAYRIADAFFLSSRLDPLPNVAIDAAVMGLPVVCFRGASGIADIMLSDPDTALGVVDHLDAEAAAVVLFNLAANKGLRDRLAGPTRNLAGTTFDMDGYFARLDSLGRVGAAHVQQVACDSATLTADPSFDQDMYLGLRGVVQTRQSTIAQYLALGSARGWNDLPAPDPFFRRPAPGFNPRVYAAAYSSQLAGTVDPLADFIRQGKPPGPWQQTVLRPEDLIDETNPGARLRTALHVHLFYPELCGDCLAHLHTNRAACDLFVTTDDPGKAVKIQRSLAVYTRGSVDVRVVPNRGRDFGPLLTALAADFENYDLIGHIHSKRSKWADGKPAENTWGEGWREFLWQNLIGGLHPMMDRIVAAFAQDDSLGLVFPADPHLVGWDENRNLAADLAGRMGWQGPLPDHFDFPLGNMFWIRRAALQPFLDLHLTWDDYPEEPVSYDGTLLHALERLSPFASQVAGFRVAVTHIFGVSWSPAFG